MAQLARVRVRLEAVLDVAVADADLVIEASPADLPAKRELFARLDSLAPAHAILATCSPTISSAYLAAATSRPDRVISLGFFSAPLAPQAVAVLQEPHVAPEVVAALAEVVWRTGREPLLLRRGREPEGVVSSGAGADRTAHRASRRRRGPCTSGTAAPRCLRGRRRTTLR